MIRRFFNLVFSPILNFLKSPTVVLIVCLFIFAVVMIKNGTAERFWSFKKSQKSIGTEMVEYKKLIDDVEVKIEKYFDMSFVKKEAIDRFDLAGENDLIFVFSQEKKVEKEIHFK